MPWSLVPCACSQSSNDCQTSDFQVDEIALPSARGVNQRGGGRWRPATGHCQPNLVAGRGLRDRRDVLQPGVLAFGILMPLIGSALGCACGLLLGLSTGGVALLMVLAASASYIAVPAAMRVALPEANPSIYLTLSLGVTFPFNLTLGIPLYVAVATALTGAG